MTVEQGRQLAIVRDYAELQTALRARVTELKTTHEAIGDLAGFQDGYVGTLLAPCPIKALGAQSLGPMLSVLGIALVVVEDLEAVRRITSRLKKREHAGLRVLAKGKRKARRYSAFRLAPEFAKLVRANQLLNQSGSERKRIAKTAARARWRTKPRRKSPKVARVSDTSPAAAPASPAPANPPTQSAGIGAAKGRARPR